MCVLSIDNYAAIKLGFGSVVAESVIKFVCNTVNSQFKKMVNPIEIMRATDGILVFFPTGKDFAPALKIMSELEKTVFSKNIKTNSGKVFKVDVLCKKLKYEAGDVFDEVLKKN